MDCTLLLLWSFLAFISLPISESSCPKLVLIEKNSKSTISCATESKEIAQAYWYRGSASRTSPILQLIDGERGGTELDKGRFEISDDGAMTILYASREHEAVYTFYAYFKDNTRENSTFKVYVTATPEPPCPHIDGCRPCTECNLQVNNNGTARCTLKGVRPKTTMKWTIESAKEVTLTPYPPVFTHDFTTDTWNVTVELSYTVFSCDEAAIVHCVAQDDYKLLKNSSSSSLKLQPNECTDGLSSNRTLLITAASVIFAALACSVMVFIFYRTKCKAGSQNHLIHMANIETQHAQPDENSDGQQKVKRLLHSLKKAYRHHCVLQPLPWGDAIPVKYGYADCYLRIKSGGEFINISSKALHTDKKLRKKEHVMIVGETRCGKTSLTKALIQNWLDEEHNDTILIYTSAKEMTENVSIINLLLQILPPDNDLSITDIHFVLTISNLWLLIDGIENLRGSLDKEMAGGNADVRESRPEMKRATENQVPNQQREELFSFPGNELSNLTVKQLLQGSNSSISTCVQVWVTSRGLVNAATLFLYQYFEVKICKFSEEQLETYIKKTCGYYFNLALLKKENDAWNTSEDQYSLKDSLLCKNDEAMSKQEEHVLPSEKAEEIEGSQEGKISNDENTIKITTDGLDITNEVNSKIQGVLDFIDNNDVYETFSSYPYLLVMIVHILAADSTSVLELPYRHIKNMTTLISTVISALEERFLLSKQNDHNNDINLIESTLEKLAFQATLEDDSILDKDSFERDLENISQTAIEIGFLQYSKHVSSNVDHLKELHVEFSVTCFEEYFAAKYIITQLEDTSYEDVMKTITEKQKTGVSKFVVLLKNT
ncbi:hypothetical protein HOLleu_36021 [Holothuria leucospilota]|uniref:Immunoglobulin domain-containing protein n=1 Tax=Holothuria leucospilota TaxID=206669 RepID=A0A9Q1BFF6_HOLLE|nr:hypothetical protein HOLleu_36021 [Holothuria leucospilota]